MEKERGYNPNKKIFAGTGVLLFAALLFAGCQADAASTHDIGIQESTINSELVEEMTIPGQPSSELGESNGFFDVTVPEGATLHGIMEMVCPNQNPETIPTIVDVNDLASPDMIKAGETLLLPIDCLNLTTAK